jgi:hypothetical protein
MVEIQHYISMYTHVIPHEPRRRCKDTTSSIPLSYTLHPISLHTDITLPYLRFSSLVARSYI